MRSYERVWSKIYDGCTRHRAHFFVLTTYRDWVFGAFSQGIFLTTSFDHMTNFLLAERTQAWISDAMTWDAKDPNILECLFYWLSSATVRRAHLIDPWYIPKVSSEEERGALLYPSTLWSVCRRPDGGVDRTALSWLRRP